jgi:hypothetical protein
MCFFRTLPAPDGLDPAFLAGFAGEKAPLRELAALRGQPISTVHRILGRALSYLQVELEPFA